VSSLNFSSAKAKSGPNECEPALLGGAGASGSVLLNMREGETRLFASSSDGGQSFGKHWRWMEKSGAKVANCQGSTVSAGKDHQMLFTVPSNAKQSRANLTLFRSGNGGQSWTVSQVVHAGPSAYSSLAATGDGDGCAAVAYEGGQTSTYQHVYFRKVCSGASKTDDVMMAATVQSTLYTHGENGRPPMLPAQCNVHEKVLRTSGQAIDRWRRYMGPDARDRPHRHRKAPAAGSQRAAPFARWLRYWLARRIRDLLQGAPGGVVYLSI